MAKTERALVAISDLENREAILQVLAACGLEPILCSTIGEARAILGSGAADVVFCESSFPDGSFDDLLHAINSGELNPPAIVCSRLYDPTLYLDFMDRGAFDFIVCPCRVEEVRYILGTAFRGLSKPTPKPKPTDGCAVSAHLSKYVAG
jgi:DNA-binding NtrC family response regulator